MKALIKGSWSSLSSSSHTWDTPRMCSLLPHQVIHQAVFNEALYREQIPCFFFYLLRRIESGEHTHGKQSHATHRGVKLRLFCPQRVSGAIPYHWQWSAPWFGEPQRESQDRAQILQGGKGQQGEIRILLQLSGDPEKTHYTDKSIYDTHSHFYATYLYFNPMHYISQTFMIYSILLIAVILGFKLQRLQRASRTTAGFVFNMKTCFRNWAGNDVWKTNKNLWPSTVKKVTDIICMVLFCTYIELYLWL